MKSAIKRVPVQKAVSSALLGEKLFFPTSKRAANNRFLKSAMSEQMCLHTPSNPATHGFPTPTYANLYEKWVAGGFGVTITGNVMVDQFHLETPGNAIIQRELDSPERRKFWRDMASRAKKHENLLIVQLSHAGRQTPKLVNPRPFSSSAISLQRDMFDMKEMGEPVELSVKEINTKVVDKFVYAAKYLYEAGFDGIELHGAHKYLLAQFLSNRTNKRTDEYGGSPKNRARIIVDIYNAIRKEIPAETGFIIGLKLNSVEFQNNQFNTAEAEEVAKIIDDVGFDFIELAGGTYESFDPEGKRESTKKRENYFVLFSSRVKPVVKNAVVYITGGFRTVPGMVEAITEKATDGIGLARPSAYELDFPNKVIKESVQSTKYSSFEYAFLEGFLACALQMSQAGKTELKKLADINEGILDLTDDKAVEEFKAASKKWMSESFALEQQGKLQYGVVPYKIEGYTGGIFDPKNP